MGNNQTVHLITSCTQSKAVKFGDSLSLSECSEQPGFDAEKWLLELANRPIKGPALDVYTGDHWSVSKDIYKHYANELWVLSAGYGLINARTEIASYDATFSTGSQNSICNNLGLDSLPQIKNQLWWQSLTSSKKESVSLTDLFKQSINGIFIFAAAPSYINVVKKEINEAIASQILNKDNLLIISSSTDRELEDFSIVTREKVRTHDEIKGSMVSLHTRVARYLLRKKQSNGYTIEKMKQEYQMLESQSSEIKKPTVQKLSDEEVISIIESLLVEIPDLKLAASVVLRKFREKGYSCEQKRFSRLFKTATRFVVE